LAILRFQTVGTVELLRTPSELGKSVVAAVQLLRFLALAFGGFILFRCNHHTLIARTESSESLRIIPVVAGRFKDSALDDRAGLSRRRSCAVVVGTPRRRDVRHAQASALQSPEWP
jgi:hypothetical protein